MPLSAGPRDKRDCGKLEIGPCLRFLDRLPKSGRILYRRYFDAASAGPVDLDPPVAPYPFDDALLKIDLFDALQADFVGLPGDPTFLDDKTAIGDHDFDVTATNKNIQSDG